MAKSSPVFDIVQILVTTLGGMGTKIRHLNLVHRLEVIEKAFWLQRSILWMLLAVNLAQLGFEVF